MKALFKAEGFRRHGSIQAWAAQEVVVLVGFTSAYDQLFIDVGFWLKALSIEAAPRVSNSHIYGRLESIFPELRPEIIDAGDCTNPEFKTVFVDTFRELLHKTIAPKLKSLASEGALVEMYLSGRLTRFAMFPGVRNYLSHRVS